MDISLFQRFAPLLQNMTEADLDAEIRQPKQLLLASGQAGRCRLDIAYAPFEYVNLNARIVIVGLTPGRQQMANALHEARRALRRGLPHPAALAEAKVYASFSGPMRANLVAMLDSIGVHRVLGIPSTGSLWEAHSSLVHFTSALRNPVFVDGTNYSGTPSMLKVPLLREQLTTGLARDLSAMPEALVVPLGPKVTEAVEMLARQGVLEPGRVLAGLPHPSGANAERIAFFLGRKPREKLSSKVNPDRIRADRAHLETRISSWMPSGLP